MIKPDQIIMASLFPSYINTGKSSTDLLISGTVADGTQTLFTATLQISPKDNRADVFATNTNTNLKCAVGTGSYIPVIQLTGTGEFSTYLLQYSTTAITLEVFVNNFTGGPVTLVTQTLHIESINYQIPF